MNKDVAVLTPTFRDELERLNEKGVIIRSTILPRIRGTQENCVQDSTWVTAWEISSKNSNDKNEFTHFHFDSKFHLSNYENFGNYVRKGTLVRFGDPSLTDTIQKRFGYASVFFLLSFFISFALMMTGAIGTVAASLIMTPFTVALIATNAQYNYSWSKDNPKARVRKNEELCYFENTTKIPQLLRMSEPVALMVRDKIMVAESRDELEDWAKSFHKVLELQENFPLDLIPMENEDLGTLAGSLSERADALRVEWESHNAIESGKRKHTEDLIAEAAELRKIQERELRKNESTIALEGALSIVNGLNLGDFEKEWKD